MDWYVADAELNQVFHDDPETHWRSVLRGMGTRYAVYANMPSNPQLN